MLLQQLLGSIKFSSVSTPVPVQHQPCDSRTCRMRCVRSELAGTFQACHLHCAGRIAWKHAALPFHSCRQSFLTPEPKKRAWSGEADEDWSAGTCCPFCRAHTGVLYGSAAINICQEQAPAALLPRRT